MAEHHHEHEHEHHHHFEMPQKSRMEEALSKYHRRGSKGGSKRYYCQQSSRERYP